MIELKAAISAEWKQATSDRVGAIILAVTATVSIVVSVFLGYLLVKYNPADANPSERTACQGLFQAGLYGIMVWVIRHYLREVSTHFGNLKSLFMAKKAPLWGAKLLVLSALGVTFALVTAVACSLATLGFLAIGGLDWSVMIGSVIDYLALVANTIIVSLGTIAFSAGIAVFAGDFGLATSISIVWLLVIESMSNGDDPEVRSFYTFLPFANGLRAYQQLPAEWFLWPTWTSEGYFLLFSFGLFTLAVLAKKNNATSNR